MFRMSSAVLNRGSVIARCWGARRARMRDAAARLQAERLEGAKARKALMAEVAAAHGAALATRAAANSGVAAYHRRDSQHVGRLC